MDTQKLYVNEKDQASFVCPQCGTHRTFDVSKHKQCTQVKIRCKCGYAFLAILEKRKYYRKKVALFGQYFKEKPFGLPEIGDIKVVDLSMTGVKFEANSTNTLKQNDIIKVDIHLDDATRSTITRSIIIRNVEGKQFGGQFCDNAQCKALAFYLMP